MRPRPGGIGRARAAVRTLVATLTAATAFGLAGLAAPPGSAAQAPPTDDVLAWGQNTYGQLGDGTTTRRLTPVAVDLPAGVRLTEVSGAAGGGWYSLGLTSDHRVLAWGRGDSGQLGDGANTNSSTPVEVDIPDGVEITDIDAGFDFGYALTSEGRVLAWGANYYGQLGDGTTTSRPTPVYTDLPAGTRITDISGGGNQTLAVTSDHRLLVWGYNNRGQLGDGTTTTRTRPVELTLPGGAEAESVTAGPYHSLVLTTDGRVYGWGYNAYGQLGDGTETNSLVPVQALVPDGVRFTALSNRGHYFSLGLTTDGRVYAWGFNTSSGFLGDGTSTNRSTPVRTLIPDDVKITQIDAGSGHSLALTSEGRIYAWGYNGDGPIGDGTTTSRPIPVLTHLPAHTRATAVSAGGFHSLALAERATSQTTLTAVPTTAAPGAPVTLTARVLCSEGTPTGNVTFYDGGTALGTVALDASGDATLTTSELSLGAHTITARYEGDDNCPASTSTGVVVVVEEPPVASLGLTKQVESAGPFQVGDTVNYTYTVTNTGTTPLYGVSVTDNRTVGVVCDATTLAAGMTTTCRGGHTITTADITPCEPADGGCALTNLAQATAYQLSGTEVASEQATATITVQRQGVSGLTLAKRADSAGPFQAGDTVDYTYTVTNTGDSAVHGLTVTDDRVADVDCGTTTLAAGASTTCHGTYTVTEADATCTRGGADGGYGGHGTTCPVTNTAHATATDTAGDTVTSDTATATIRVSGGGHDGYGDANGSDYGDRHGARKEKTA
ncbi:Ig-like domain repeat protein [Streptomyces sp. NPDC048718]|uniref:RCC1 domain-containing protein n=1 Tax=Streptomyces sp. NPDC048718 TaxID=3365587 RepID=UPI0037115C05